MSWIHLLVFCSSIFLFFLSFSLLTTSASTLVDLLQALVRLTLPLGSCVDHSEWCCLCTPNVPDVTILIISWKSVYKGNNQIILQMDHIWLHVNTKQDAKNGEPMEVRYARWTNKWDMSNLELRIVQKYMAVYPNLQQPSSFCAWCTYEGGEKAYLKLKLACRRCRLQLTR